jgi:hypothetical protein
MPLPTITAPTYELELPSNGQKIKYRPFIMKEEKLLLLALESKDKTQMVDAIRTILKNCILTSRIKIENLALFDIEYIFLNIRGKSVGENIELVVTCPDDGETTVDVTINIDEIKVDKPIDHINIITISDDIKVVMRYPGIDTFVDTIDMFSDDEDPGKDNIEEDKLAATCIHQIIKGSDVYETKNFTQAEIIAFLESMTSDQFAKIRNFFQTMPKLKHVIKITNPNTKKEHEIPITGLASFFG